MEQGRQFWSQGNPGGRDSSDARLTKGHISMISRKTLAPALLLGMAVAVAASAADDFLVRFKGGIGVMPVKGNTATTIVPDTVQGVKPGAAPWVIESLAADVRTDGRISVDGRGRLPGGTDRIGGTGGTAAAPQMVRARLFCDGQPSAQTGLVPFEADGDFRINDTLNPVPAAPCTRPVLLIVSAGESWFAAGIPRR